MENWIEADKPPQPKENWKHTEQCLVWYEGIPNEKVSTFGIAYYNYEPPFKEKGEWIDFCHYGRQPTHYIPLPSKPFMKSTIQDSHDKNNYE